MTPECERHEIEMGMRQHGALDARQVAALDAHIAGCPSCQRFAAASGASEDWLRQQAQKDAAQVDWNALQGGVRRVHRSYRRKFWLAPLFLFQLPVAALLATGHLPDKQLLAIVPVSNLSIYLGYIWLVSRPFRVTMAAVKGGGDLLRGYARELRWQRLRAWVFAVVNLLVAFGTVAMAFAQPGLRLRLYGLLCLLLFGGWAAYDLGVKLPRLRRALREMGQ